jgi:hypothetical protein
MAPRKCPCNVGLETLTYKWDTNCTTMGWIVQSRLRTVLTILIFFGIFLLSLDSFLKKSPAPVPFSPPASAPFPREEKHADIRHPHPRPIPNPTPQTQGNTLSLLTAIVSMLGTLSTIYFAWLDHRIKQKETDTKFAEYERSKLSRPGS